MKKLALGWGVVLVLLLAACGNGEEETDELAMLEVEFNVPETAEAGETVELEAIVTYGDKPVEEADEVLFEYWLTGHEDASKDVEGVHTEGGRYVADVTFEEDGVYEMYAHTTAEGLHTMPLTSITVGDPEEADHADHGDHEHSDGVHIHFMELEGVRAGNNTELVSHLHLEGEELEGASVRYEIISDGEADRTEWVDAEETAAGEYAADHTFEEAGIYTVVIHAEDDADLHEHEEYTVEIE